MSDTQSPPDLTALTVNLLSSFVSNNTVRVDELPKLISDTHSALAALAPASATAPTPAPAEKAPAERFEPAVTVRRSLASREHIISLIDGKPYKTLRRHLTARGLTPEQYRARYKLPADYPMVAPAYSEARRETAKRLGLGRKRAAGTAPGKGRSSRRRAAAG